jgi:quinolinate synthase
MHLGNYVSTQLPDVEIITYPGYCPTHLRILPQDILDLREEYPEAKVLAHPECHKEVIKLADFTGSTTQIMKYCAESKKHSFIIATEKGVVERLDRDHPEKTFMIASQKAYCPNMKWHNLDDILYALENEEHEINVEQELIEKALLPIQKMIDLQKIVH